MYFLGFIKKVAAMRDPTGDVIWPTKRLYDPNWREESVSISWLRIHRHAQRSPWANIRTWYVPGSVSRIGGPLSKKCHSWLLAHSWLSQSSALSHPRSPRRRLAHARHQPVLCLFTFCHHHQQPPLPALRPQAGLRTRAPSLKA
jgi:hypothetical protein